MQSKPVGGPQKHDEPRAERRTRRQQEVTNQYKTNHQQDLSFSSVSIVSLWSKGFRSIEWLRLTLPPHPHNSRNFRNAGGTAVNGSSFASYSSATKP